MLKQILPGKNGDAVAGLLSVIPNTKQIPLIVYDVGIMVGGSARYSYKESEAVTAFLPTDDGEHLRKRADQLLSETD